MNKAGLKSDGQPAAPADIEECLASKMRACQCVFMIGRGLIEKVYFLGQFMHSQSVVLIKTSHIHRINKHLGHA